MTFTNGPGIEHLRHTAGQAYASNVLPDQASACDEERLSVVCGELGLQIEV
jgi:hypothetical protein